MFLWYLAYPYKQVKGGPHSVQVAVQGIKNNVQYETKKVVQEYSSYSQLKQITKQLATKAVSANLSMNKKTRKMAQYIQELDMQV